MKSKNVKKVVITGIATVVGVFGGLKIYSNKKNKTEPKIIKLDQEDKSKE